MTADLDRVVAAYAQWDHSRGADKSMWTPLFADMVDFRSLGAGRERMAFTAPRKTPAEIAAYLDGLTDAFAMIHYTVDDTIEQDGKIVIYGRTAWRSRATGREFETPIMTLWRFDRGKAVAFHEFIDTAMIVAAASP
jgi:uncharacterized protein